MMSNTQNFSLEGKVALVTELLTELDSQSQVLWQKLEQRSYLTISSRNW